MAVKKVTKPQWEYQGKVVESLKDMPPNTLGIVYRIENLDTGKYYIGRRTVCGNKKRKLTVVEKKLPENSRKTWAYELKESSGWKTYCGSNVTLKAEVANGANIKKYILHYCFSKAEITYRESAEIICSGALEDILAYNDWVKCTIYKKHLISAKKE
jgi:hypothetical protein